MARRGLLLYAGIVQTDSLSGDVVQVELLYEYEGNDFLATTTVQSTQLDDWRDRASLPIYIDTRDPSRCRVARAGTGLHPHRDLQIPSPRTTTDAAVVEKLQDFGSFAFPEGCHLTNILEFFANISLVPINVDWNSLQRLGVRPDSPLEWCGGHAPLAYGLRRVLDLVSAGQGEITYRISNGAIEVQAAQVDR